jgi:glycosyltransferase involved in cell wall biosynthesis
VSVLRVGVEARLQDGVSGGVQQIVLGLAQGLSRLDGPEEYHFHVYPDSCEWLEPYLRGPCRRLDGGPLGIRKTATGLKRALKPLLTSGPLDWAWGRFSKRLKDSDGTFERAGMEALHFPYQAAFRTGIPSVYQPHDLQHLHYPAYFSASERDWRERSYRAWCAQAALVVMMTHWGKDDLIRQYGLAPQKVAVVEGGSVTADYPPLGGPEQEALLGRLGLGAGEAFLLYPAQAFPHKNHLRLLEALAVARGAFGVPVKLVCTGGSNPHLAAVLRRRQELGLEKVAVFSGFLNGAELRALYTRALGLIFPSQFEGWGLPLTEAFQEGLAVACSRACGLPEHAGEAAIYFDAEDVAGMADCMVRLVRDPGLRGRLSALGRERAAAMTWERAALTFRAHYRRLAGRTLDERDRALVAASLAPRPPETR